MASAAATQLVDVSVSRAPHDPPASTGPRAGSGRRRSRRPACDCPKGTPHGTPNGELRCWHLPRLVADVVEFLFFCPWRVGAARRLDWRDYSEADGTLTLRPEINKTAHELQIPVDAESILVTQPETAVSWRASVRRGLQWGLSQGYAVNGFYSDEEEQQAYYLLTRQPRPWSITPRP